MNNPIRGHQSIKYTQNPLTGLSPELSKDLLSHNFPTAAAGLCSYLNTIHNTVPIQKRRQHPQWIRRVVMVTDKVVRYHSLQLWKAHDHELQYNWFMCACVQSGSVTGCMNSILEEGRKWTFTQNKLQFLNLSPSSQSPHKSNTSVCMKNISSLISRNTAAKDLLLFALTEKH